MREIKFKTWLPYTKVMMRPKDIQTFHEQIISGVTIGQTKQWVYLQFTGLQDKNGKDIYEGDIVRCSDWVEDAHCNNSWVRTVEWDLDNGMWLGVEGETNEVIGNIYEHQKLLPTVPYDTF